MKHTNIKQPNTESWMTIEDLSQYIGLTKSSIYKKTCYRKIPFYRPGKILFKKSEIDDWIQSSRIETLDEPNQSLILKP